MNDSFVFESPTHFIPIINLFIWILKNSARIFNWNFAIETLCPDYYLRSFHSMALLMFLDTWFFYVGENVQHEILISHNFMNGYFIFSTFQNYILLEIVNYRKHNTNAGSSLEVSWNNLINYYTINTIRIRITSIN